MVSRKRFAVALLAALALFVAACGGDDDSGGGGGGGGAAKQEETGVTKGVAKAPTPDQAKGATGNVTFCLGKDTSGNQTAAVKKFNAKYKAQGLSAKLLEFPTSSSSARRRSRASATSSSPT